MPNPFITAPFRPFGDGVVIPATVGTNRAALPRAMGQSVVVSNPIAGSLAFIKLGSSTVTAATTDAVILPGTTRIFSALEADTHIAVVLDTGAGNIYVSVGDGI